MGKVAVGDGKRVDNSYKKKTTPLSDNAWLVSKYFPFSRNNAPGRTHVLQRKKDGKYELGEMLEGVNYAVNGVIRLPSGKYLLSDDYNGLRSNEVVSTNYDLSMLSLHHTFNDIEDLKDNLSRIVEVGGKSNLDFGK